MNLNFIALLKICEIRNLYQSRANSEEKVLHIHSDLRDCLLTLTCETR